MVQKHHRLLFFSKGQQIKKKPSAFAQISLPVPINFVARGFIQRRAWFFTHITMVYHADGRIFFTLSLLTLKT